MSLSETLVNEMKAAMKAGDARRRDALRLLVSSVKYAEIDAELTDEKVREVLAKEAKKRRESVEAYRKGGREEAAAQEEYELSVIEEYLPKMMSEEEVRAKVEEIVAGKEYPNFGAAMGEVMGELKGKAEGGVISKVVKEVVEN